MNDFCSDTVLHLKVHWWYLYPFTNAFHHVLICNSSHVFVCFFILSIFIYCSSCLSNFLWHFNYTSPCLSDFLEIHYVIFFFLHRSNNFFCMFLGLCMCVFPMGFSELRKSSNILYIQGSFLKCIVIYKYIVKTKSSWIIQKKFIST